MLEWLLIITSVATIVAWIIAYITAVKGMKHSLAWFVGATGVSLVFICVAAKYVSELIIL